VVVLEVGAEREWEERGEGAAPVLSPGLPRNTTCRYM